MRRLLFVYYEILYLIILLFIPTQLAWWFFGAWIILAILCSIVYITWDVTNYINSTLCSGCKKKIKTEELFFGMKYGDFIGKSIIYHIDCQKYL